MADTLLKGVIVNLSCGQPESRTHNILWQVGGRAATMADLGAIMTEGVRRTQADGREAVHSFPLGFTVDATGGVDDPRGMVCDTLGARLHVLDASSHALFNLGQCLQRCELEVEELVSSPFAAGLATLVDDERELGAVCVDMGGGTTSIAAFAEGRLMHTAQLPVGGWQVTNGRDDTVVARSATAGTPLRLSRNGRWLAVLLPKHAGWELWDLAQGEAKLRDTLSGYPEDLSDDGKLAAFYHQQRYADGTVYAEVRETETGRMRFKLTFPQVALKMRFNAEGTLCAVAPSSYLNESDFPYSVRLH
eukprot:gene46356-56763_t